MKAEIFGTLTRPAAIITGTWDALIPGYYELIDYLNKYCQEAGYDALLVVLDPSPQHLLHGKTLPVYDCWETRVRQLQAVCQGAVARFSMTEDELGDGVEDFLNVFFEQDVKIAELWLYEGQTMGRGTKSNLKTLANSCASAGVTVKNIPEELNVKQQSHKARELLAEGMVQEAAEIVRHMPTWQKREAGEPIAIGWKEGTYKYYPARLIIGPTAYLINEPATLKIYANEKGNTVFDWPDPAMKYLVFSKIVP